MKRNRFLILALTIVFVLASIQLTFAKDVSSDWEKGANPEINVLTTGSFEKSNDSDCYSFISGGGSYKLLVYSKDAEIDPDITEDEIASYAEMGWDYMYMPFEVIYGGYEKFSAAGGDPARYQLGSIRSTDYYIGAKIDADGWYVGEIDLGKYSKNQKVGLRFDTKKKGAYKFKIIGKAAPGPKKVTLKSAKGKSKAITAKWGKVSSAAGYQIQYSTDSSFASGNKAALVSSGSTTSKTVKISSKGKYYVRVRAYNKIHGVRCYGKWSAAKSANVK
jgi:hypothetical protein